MAHPGSMKRAGPELLPFSHSSIAERRRMEHHWKKSHIPIPHHSAAQHDAAQRKGMARQPQQQQQVRCTTRGTGRRSGTTRRMAWRRVSKPAFRYACIHSVLWVHTPYPVLLLLLQKHHPIPVIHRIAHERQVVVTIRCSTEWSYTFRPRSLPQSLPPTDPGAPLTVHRGPGRQPYLRGK